MANSDQWDQQSALNWKYQSGSENATNSDRTSSSCRWAPDSYDPTTQPLGSFNPLAANDDAGPYQAPQHWPDQEGEISREDFNTYRHMKDRELEQQRQDRADCMALTVAECRRLLEKEQPGPEGSEVSLVSSKGDSSSLRDPVRYAKLVEQSRLLEEFKELPAKLGNLPVRVLNEPSWPPKQDIRRRQYLYNNALDNRRELKCLIYCELSHKLLMDGDLRAGAGFCEKAYVKARKLDYVPLEGKCAYWKGRIAYEAGNYKLAGICFSAARHSIGRYVEGDDVEEWVNRTEHKKPTQQKTGIDRHSSQREGKKDSHDQIEHIHGHRRSSSDAASAASLDILERTGQFLNPLRQSILNIKTENLGRLIDVGHVKYDSGASSSPGTGSMPLSTGSRDSWPVPAFTGSPVDIQPDGSSPDMSKGPSQPSSGSPSRASSTPTFEPRPSSTPQTPSRLSFQTNAPDEPENTQRPDARPESREQ